jgi:hypothetical protein
MSLKARLFGKLSKPELVPCTFMNEPCWIKPWSERERLEWVVYCDKTMRAVLARQEKEKAGELTVSDTEKQAEDLQLQARVIAWSLCDENGELIFGRDGTMKVAEYPAKEVYRLFHEISRVQRVDEQEKEADAKKSETTPG